MAERSLPAIAPLRSQGASSSLETRPSNVHFIALLNREVQGSMTWGKQIQCSFLDLVETAGTLVSPDKRGPFVKGGRSLPTGAGTIKKPEKVVAPLCG